MVQPESNKGFKLVLETALLAAPAPLTVSELRRLFEDDPGSDEVRRVLGELVEDWQGRGVSRPGSSTRSTSTASSRNDRRSIRAQFSKPWRSSPIVNRLPAVTSRISAAWSFRQTY